MSTPIHAIYASTSGNTESVVETVRDVFGQHDLELVLHRAEVTPFEVLMNNPLFVLATSTWEHGVINPLYTKLLDALTASADTFLSGKKAAFIGCGDHRYEPVLFCEGMKELKRTFLQKGGEAIGDELFIGGDPCMILDTLVKDWAIKTATTFQKLQGTS